MILSRLPVLLLGLLLLSVSHAASLVMHLVDSTDPTALYQPFKFIGDGSSGRVYKARVNQRVKINGVVLDKDEYAAVKIIPLRNCKAENIAREIALLRSNLPHPGIVGYLSSHIVDAPFNLSGEASNERIVHGEGDETVVTQYVWIATEWIEGANLSQVVDDHASAVRAGDIPAGPAFEPARVRALARPLFSALKHLHDQQILHGDIDISNILAVESTKPVLIDMGNADKDPSRFEEDVIRMIYSLVEMSMSPIIYSDGFDDGPVNIKLYGALRSVSVRIFLEKMRQREWKIPEDLYGLVVHVLELPVLTVDAVLQHPYFSTPS